MDAAAKLIALAPGDAQLLPAAGAKVAAVGPSAGRAGVAVEMITSFFTRIAPTLRRRQVPRSKTVWAMSR